MADSIESRLPSGLDVGALLKRQREHDANFHRDIQGLSLGPRIQHLTLHLAKYVGRLAQASLSPNQDSGLIRTLTDALIVCLSICNALGLEAEAIVTACVTERIATKSTSELTIALAIPVGRLAKVSEALDHLENLHYSAEIRANVLSTISVLLNSWPAGSNGAAGMLSKRWNEIERGRVP